MFRTTCDFELLQEYLVKIVKIARASEATRRDVPGVVELHGLEWALRWCGIQWKMGLCSIPAARWVQQSAPIY